MRALDIATMNSEDEGIVGSWDHRTMGGQSDHERTMGLWGNMVPWRDHWTMGGIMGSGAPGVPGVPEVSGPQALWPASYLAGWLARYLASNPRDSLDLGIPMNPWNSWIA